MKKRVLTAARRLKGRRSYTVRELARALCVHRRTVLAWKKAGLSPIEPGGRPLLFMGGEVKRFLEARRQARKCPLKPDQFFCPRCRSARQARPGSVTVEDTGRRLGKADSSLVVHGLCEKCGCQLRLFTSRKRLNPTWKHMLDTAGDGRLWGTGDHPVNTDTGGHATRETECPE